MSAKECYWLRSFLPGSCYRDFYFGKEHLLVKAHCFISEGFKSNDLCLYHGSWEEDVVANLKHGCDCANELMTEGHLLFLDNNCYRSYFDLPGNKYFLQAIHQQVIKRNYNVARVFWQMEDYEERIYSDRFVEVSSEMEKIIGSRKLFILFLCNFEALLAKFRKNTRTTKK